MKWSIVIVAAIVLFTIFLIYGCATIIHGTSQKVGLSSSPTGAKINVDNVELGVTPVFADLKRGDAHIVSFTLEGYQKTDLTITKSTSGWVWGNIVFGGLIGLAVDALSGGLYDLSPEQLNAELKKNQASMIRKDGLIYVMTVLQPDPSWKKIGNLSPTNHY